MTPRSRIVLVLAAVAVLVGGFVLAQGSGDDDSSTTTTTTQAATTPATTTSADHTGHDTSTTTTAPAEPATPTISVKGGKPVGGVQSIEVSKGDQVAFKVKSDVADEIHVHGYDLMKDVAAGGSVSFAFKATIDGKFEIELENAGEQIAALTVNP